MNCKSDEKGPPSDYQQFSPSKRAKGLVYYSDRIDELKIDPTLAKFSPPPPSSSSKVLENAIKVESMAETKFNLDFELEDLPDQDAATNHGKQKIATSTKRGDIAIKTEVVSSSLNSKSAPSRKSKRGLEH